MSHILSRRRVWPCALVLLTLFVAACGAPSAEERARDAADEIRKGMTDPDQAALDQKVGRDVVRQVQQALTERHEYMGNIDGKLDSVTVNAIQAFQRSVNAAIPWWTPWEKLNDKGIIDAPTLAQLVGPGAQG